MRNRSNIVSFEDALKHGQSASHQGQTSALDSADAHHLSQIFHIEFDQDPFADAPASAAVDAAIFTFEDEEDEANGSGKKGFFKKLSEKRNAKKREAAKAKADKQFDSSMIGSSAKSADTDAGPRAALHQYQMGSSQKRATRMQSRNLNPSGIAFSLPRSIKLPNFSKRTIGALISLVCVAILAASLYTPAQHYYKQVRERDRLAAEYAAVSERNDSLQEIVDSLQSKSGIEDKAHKDFGLVKDGEKAGSVSGIEVERELDFEANIPPGSISAPETWYSGFLDFLFGYQS